MTNTAQIAGEPRNVAPEINCRLCGGRAVFGFEKTVIGKYRVSFYHCTNCGSQQSEIPYWLSEAYSDPSLLIDPGAAQRVLNCLGLTSAIAKLFGFKRMLDYGGGAGLFCRLLRDVGFDAFWYDGYTPPGYANGFEASPSDKFDLVTAFEVVEHFSNPKDDLNILFAAGPKAVLLMTYLYTGQDENWWYLASEEGQHVFFYSPNAMEMIARQYGYHLTILPGFVLFSQTAPSNMQKRILRFLTPRVLHYLRLAVLARKTDAPQKDSTLLERRIQDRFNARNSEPDGK